MVEGRISQGVVVDAGSDIGGGASIMGTLSGGGKCRSITIGQRCLLGGELGLGISLGDDCVIESRLYLTAGHHRHAPDGSGPSARAEREVGAVFRRNSVSGSVEVIAVGHVGSLSADFHAHQ